LTTLCVGWWVTWPAEEIRGYMVAPYSAGGQNEVNWKGNFQKDLPDQTWPRELFAEIFPIAAAVNEKERFLEVDAPYFGGVDLASLTEQERTMVAQTRWSESADATYAEIARTLLPRMAQEGTPPDLTMVYLGGPDVASHRFWRYRDPAPFGYPIPPESIAELADTIHRFYAETDRQLGTLLAALPAGGNVIVCSDHGFGPYATERPHPTGISGHHFDGPPGIVVAAGPDIEPDPAGAAKLLGSASGEVKVVGRLYEVAPLAMHLLGIPLSQNLAAPDGGLLLRSFVSRELLAKRKPEPLVYSHDEGFRLATDTRHVGDDQATDALAWMEQLGYISNNGKGREGRFEEVLPGRTKKDDP
jgi:hypothetical protein